MIRMKARQWICLAVWFALYLATLEFFRFRFGLFRISAVFLVSGILAIWSVGRIGKSAATPRP